MIKRILKLTTSAVECRYMSIKFMIQSRKSLRKFNKAYLKLLTVYSKGFLVQTSDDWTEEFEPVVLDYYAGLQDIQTLAYQPITKIQLNMLTREEKSNDKTN